MSREDELKDLGFRMGVYFKRVQKLCKKNGRPSRIREIQRCGMIVRFTMQIAILRARYQLIMSQPNLNHAPKYIVKHLTA